MASLNFFSSLLVVLLVGEGWATIDDHCTDISYWDVIKYETTSKQCCDTKLKQVCTDKNDQVCADVLELKCDVVAWGECISTPTSTKSTKCSVEYKDYDHQNCEDVKTSVSHTKKVPECKTITKNNCLTDWEVDDNGNKVWAGTETCTPVSWEECEIVEKTVDFPTVKTECGVNAKIKWVDFVDTTRDIVGLESKCEVKTAVNCQHEVVNKCAGVAWRECNMEPFEECRAVVVHTPDQEKVHQKKCLTSDQPQPDCSCSDFVNSNGIGKCQERVKIGDSLDSIAFAGQVACYVNLPTSCSDAIASETDPGKYISAEACSCSNLDPNNAVAAEACLNIKLGRVSTETDL